MKSMRPKALLSSRLHPRPVGNHQIEDARRILVKRMRQTATAARTSGMARPNAR